MWIRDSPFGAEATLEPLNRNAGGMPNGMAFVLSNISLSHNAREHIMTVGPMATHSSKPDDFHRLFADTVHMHQDSQAARDGNNIVATPPSANHGMPPWPRLHRVSYIGTERGTRWY